MRLLCHFYIHVTLPVAHCIEGIVPICSVYQVFSRNARTAFPLLGAAEQTIPSLAISPLVKEAAHMHIIYVR